MSIGLVLTYHIDEPAIVNFNITGQKGEIYVLNKTKFDAMRKQMNEEFDRLWLGNVNDIVTLVSK